MNYFWPIFLSVAISGSAGIYWGTPHIRPYLPAAFIQHANGLRERVGQSSNRQDNQENSEELTEGDSVLTPEMIAELENKAGIKRPAPKTTPRAEEPEEELIPILHNITLAGKGDKIEWGVIHTPTSLYGANLTKQGVLPSGSLLLYRQTHNSANNGQMVEGLILDENFSTTPVLVRRKDIYLFTGDYSKLSDRQLNSLRDYYDLKGKIFLREQKLAQEAARKNPFFTEYQAQAKKLMRHTEQNKKLVAEREQATMQRRAALEDQLRNAKMREVRLQQEYNKIHEKYLAWKNEHAADTTDFKHDPQIQEWQKQQQAAKRFIPGLAF